MNEKRNINKLARELYYDMKEKYIRKVQSYERLYDLNRKLLQAIRVLKSQNNIYIIGRKYNDRAVSSCAKTVAKYFEDNNLPDEKKEILVDLILKMKLPKVTTNNIYEFKKLHDEIENENKKSLV
jgi:hypothetical protein